MTHTVESNYLLCAFLRHLVAKIRIGKKEIRSRKLLRYVQFSVFSVRFRWFNSYKLWLDYSSSLGDNFGNISSAFQAFFPNFCEDFSPRSAHFFPTFCYNIALIAQHYCPYFSPVFAHLRLNFCSN